MKNVVVISFTRKGSELASKIIDKFQNNNTHIDGFSPDKYIQQNISPLPPNIGEFIGEIFYKYDSLVFVGATGIAVRLIAPYIKNKTTDPAVVVIDEQGHYAISLLSGHMGGGCQFTKLLSQMIGATPIITTATDINSIFAIDVWAKKKEFAIINPEDIKIISASLLDGEGIGLYSYFPIRGDLPKNIELSNKYNNGVIVTPFTDTPIFQQTLHITPTCIHIGVGCKKNINSEKFENFLLSTLEENAIHIKSISTISSIDLKSNEKAILDFTEKYNIKFSVYNATTLMNAEGSFTASDFVLKTTGVDNVCERSAYISSEKGNFICRKKVYEGITISIVCEETQIEFV